MRDLVINIVNSLVERPGDVQLTVVEGEKTSIFELRCHASDVGKVIGKNGKTVSAIRGLLNAVAFNKGRRAVIEVVE